MTLKGKKDSAIKAIYDKHKYSAAVRAGDLLFVSGQVGSREDGSPEPEFEMQVQRAFDHLAEAAAGFNDIVDVTTFHTDPESQFAAVLKVKDRLFPSKSYPTWTAVGVNWLAGFDFEIKIIARIPS
ncbi:RidA family protein [Paracoccus aerius]|uniref:RidA family protein n=1 Tax=Paracoccus aerius TaxID=1915382 RepID=A0ABS1S9N1_9RHOB|nr:RidA family protein [Paracoccus aerius]MBL3675413.1 RidA family protein [Paracoccus aerius]GHG33518.1 hypothetical protein GCM10017322_35750 [Paracoccus aerius]